MAAAFFLFFMAGMVSPLSLVTHPLQLTVPPNAFSSWYWEPSILLALSLLAALYARGVIRLWRRAGFGRGVSAGQAAAFVAGLLAALMALVSPLD
ncbi:MAG TPA: hypothetical protein VF498_10980 [Anaerolineales bacterium]